MIKKLEALRGFTALYVVIHHFIGYSVLKQILPAVLRFPFRFGQEAVILFFLLSGFVIYYAQHGKELNYGDYLLKRFRRIYPLVICSFLLSIIVTLLNHKPLPTVQWTNLVGNLLMLQDTSNKPGQWFDVFLDNHALWSLSYEWIFYLIFPFFYKYVWNRANRIYTVLLFSGISWLTFVFFPNHLMLVFSYFIIWWAGVEFAAVYIRHKTFTMYLIKPIVISLGAITLLSIIPIVIRFFLYRRHFTQIMYPIITFRHFSFSLAIVLLGLLWWKMNLKGYDFLLSKFKVLASISYGLYIIHFPILWLDLSFLKNSLLEVAVKFFLVVVISYLLEIKVQKYINALFRTREKHSVRFTVSTASQGALP